MSKFAAGSSRCRKAAIAALIFGVQVALATATANATDQDAKYLADLAQMNITFATPQQAIQQGQAVCGTFKSGLAAGLSDAAIRGRAISNLKNAGLSDTKAFQLMGIAVADYCPQYLDAAGD